MASKKGHEAWEGGLRLLCNTILYEQLAVCTRFHGLKPLKRMLFESIFQLILHTKRVNNTESRHGQGIQAFLRCKSDTCSETQNCKIWLFCFILSWEWLFSNSFSQTVHLKVFSNFLWQIALRLRDRKYFLIIPGKFWNYFRPSNHTWYIFMEPLSCLNQESWLLSRMLSSLFAIRGVWQTSKIRGRPGFFLSPSKTTGSF